MDEDAILKEQLAYYRARAPEYDECFCGQGRHDRGPQHRAEWFRELRFIEAELQPLVQGKKVLELAAGTGLWTRRLLAAAQVMAVDGSPETLAINRDRVQSSHVRYQIADIFSLRPTTTFDVVFFSFWLSHVPSHLFNYFWDMVHSALKPKGRVFFIDEQQSAECEDAHSIGSGIACRKLNDGRKFQIVKIFYEPSALEQKLRERGWRGRVRCSGTSFFYGLVRHVSE
jgi:demethylmenaquinone methyltransferase/2-methoxy-6-polyprenyl-1,4-benzoquinol methylase